MKLLSRLSLRRQVMLLVALGLICAQGVNFVLTLRDRQEFSLQSAAAPAIARLVQGISAAEEGPPLQRRGPWRMRMRVTGTSPIATDAARLPRIEALARARLDEDAGIAVTDVRAALIAGRRDNRLLIISVQLENGQWVTTRSRGPAPLGPVIAALIVQTVVILGVLLVPLLLLVGNVTRPLAALTRSAREWNASQPSDDLVPQGPGDVRELITAINEMRGRITAMLREKDVMLGAIGHDLRTPLTSLRIEVEGIADDDHRSAMIAQIERLSDDFEGILSLARSPDNVRKENHDLSRLIARVAQDFTQQGKAVAIAPCPPVMALIDPLAMRRAVTNLVDNALRYGTAASIRVERNQRMACIIVEDQGPGIPDHLLEEAASAFVRLEPSRNRMTGGHGLGLAIVAAIARVHGGSVSLANRAGGGLRATIRVPAGADLPER